MLCTQQGCTWHSLFNLGMALSNRSYVCHVPDCFCGGCEIHAVLIISSGSSDVEASCSLV